MNENKNENTVALNGMQKKISARDIVLVRNKNDEIGQPYLITFANQGDDFMCAMRILPSKNRNDLTISPDYFNNPKTPDFNNGGYVNVYTGLNTIRRQNVTTWVSSLDNDSYIRIVYACFAGMLGYYSTNGKFNLPQPIPLQFSINVNMLNAIKNSGIQQKNGEIFVPPAKKNTNQQQASEQNKKNSPKVVAEQPKQDSAWVDEPAAVQTDDTKNNDGWNNPPANMPDPAIIEMISGSDTDSILIDKKLVNDYGLNVNDYAVILNVGDFEIYVDEFITAIANGTIDIMEVFSGNSITTACSNDHANVLVKLCNDVYQAAKKKIA